MGDAREKLQREGESLVLDFAAMGLPVGKVPPDKAPADWDAKKHVRTFIAVVGAAVGACYPQGMERKESRTWAAWQDALEDEPEQTTVTRGMIAWLAKRMNDAKLPPVMSSLREAATDYLDELEKNGTPAE